MAVAASQTHLDAHPGRQPAELATSLCLPVDPVEDERIRALGRWQFAAIIGGALLSLAGAMLLVRGYGIWQGDNGLWLPEEPLLVPPGWLLLIAGVGALVWSSAFADRRKYALLRDEVRDRTGTLLPHGHPLPELFVALEDLETATVLKLNPEDVGLLGVDRPGQRILIEGCAHRYLIRCEDVVSWTGPAVGGFYGATIQVLIAGAVELGLAVSHGHIARQVVGQTGHRVRLQYRTMEQALADALGPPH